VIASAGGAEKAELIRSLGAEPIDYTSEDLFDRVNALTDDHGADVCADMIGGEGTETVWTCMAREGRYVAVGFNDDPESGLTGRPLRKVSMGNFSVLGVMMGYNDMPVEFRRFGLNLNKLLKAGQLKPVAAQATSRTYAEAGPSGTGAPPARPTVWLLATVSLVIAAAARSSHVMAVDTFYDLTAGRYLFDHGIPRQNALTAVAHGAPWIDQQWLAQATYYCSWLAAGYRGVAIVSVALTAGGTCVLALAMLRRGAWPSRMFAWSAAAFVVALCSYQIQAQNFGYLLFPLTLLLVVGDMRRHRPGWQTWLLIGVLILWANLHGSVLLGSALIATYAGYRAVRAMKAADRGASLGYLGLGVAAIAAVACTPYGFGVIGYYRRLIGNPELAAHISRWAPPDLHDPATWVFVAVAVAVIGAVGLARTRGSRPEPFLAASALVLLGLALMAAGNECWFAFAGCLLAAEAQAKAGGLRAPALRTGFTAVVAGLMATLAVASLAALALTPDARFENQVPRRAIEVAATIARQHPGAHILGDAYTSTAMLWLEPITVGRDGFDARLEQYPGAALHAYFDFLFARGPRWQRVTRGYGIIVVSRLSEPLARDLERLSGWRVAYADPDGLVLVRSQAR